jgi:hypothetical protein
MEGCVFIAKKRNLIDEIIFADLYKELNCLDEATF